MSGSMPAQNDQRDYLVTALEYGVCPLVQWDDPKTDE